MELFGVGLWYIYIVHLGVYLGLRSKKNVKQQRSRTVKKQSSKEAEKQRSREAGKGRKAEKQQAEKQNSGEAEKQRSIKAESREKQKSKKQRSKQGNRNPKKMPKTGKKIIPKQYSPPYIIDMKESPELHPNSFNSGDKTPWTWKPRPGLMPIELEPSSWKGPAP